MADAAEPPNNPNAAQVAGAAAPQRNRMPGGAQNNLINVRERLFHAIYFKVALMYAQIVPPWARRTLEYFILFKALIFFGALVYLHMAFIKNPATCLQHVKDWPRDGVLRVEVIPNLEEQRALIRRSRSYEKLISDLQHFYHYGIGPQTRENYYRWRQYEQILKEAGYQLKTSYVTPNETITYLIKRTTTTNAINNVPPLTATGLKLPPMAQVAESSMDSDDGDFIYSILFKRSAFLMLLDASGNADEQYIVEYSLEYGHLRLSSATRKRLHIPVRVVQLDPMKDKCFGDDFSKFMLKKVLGYDDLLMASVRVIAEQENNQGYLRNVITGEHYRFVSMWWAAWSSYPTAFAVMLLFTFSISMLLRFSHHQIFVFIVDLLQMLEFNVTARFPIAPLLTVILALVGMEAIMSEFFNDTTTAFYIILIVWIADQYDAICCHTTITKRHWLRFFYLYHFAFYAYHYRFSGQNRNLSLITSWLFIQHSMLFFFHRFELPVIAQQAHIIILTRNQPPANAAAAGGDGGNAAAAGLDGIGGAVGGGGGAAAAGQQGGRRILFFRRQPAAALQPGQAFRLPLLNMLPIRNRPLRWETIQRALLQRGWRGGHHHVAQPVRIQVGNIHRINIATEAAGGGHEQNLATDSADLATNTVNNVATNSAEIRATTTTTTLSGGNVAATGATTATNASTAAQLTKIQISSATENVAVEATNENSQTTESNHRKDETTAMAMVTPTATTSHGFDAAACFPGTQHVDETSQINKNQQQKQENNNKTGNNNVKQPETDEQENKIENEVPPPSLQQEQQQQEKEQKQKKSYNGNCNNVEDDGVGESKGDDGHQYSTSSLTTTRKINSAAQKEQKQKIILNNLTTAATTAIQTQQSNNNNKNEQLEGTTANDFYEVVANHKITKAKDDKVESEAIMMATKSDQTPLLQPTPTTITATGDESNNNNNRQQQQQNSMKQILPDFALKVADIAQTVNQANIENRDHNNTTSLSSSTSSMMLLLSESGCGHSRGSGGVIGDVGVVVGCGKAAATATFQTNEKFDMIDNADGRGQTHRQHNVDENIATTTIKATTTSHDNNNPTKNFKSTLNHIPKDTPSNMATVAFVHDNNGGGNGNDDVCCSNNNNKNEKQHLTNFIANEEAGQATSSSSSAAAAKNSSHSSEF